MANDTNSETRPSAQEVRATLAALLKTAPLARSPKISSLLTYLVTARLDGTAEDLTETAIAAAVFGQTEGFNPRSNPIVRVNASRLRNLLKSHYAGAGANDAIQIRLAKVGYEPVFTGSALAARTGLEPDTQPATPLPDAPPPEAPQPAIAQLETETLPKEAPSMASPLEPASVLAAETGMPAPGPIPEGRSGLRQRLRAPASTALVLTTALAAVLTSVVYIHVALQMAQERPALKVSAANAASR